MHKPIASFQTVNLVIYADFEVIEFAEAGMCELIIYICVYERSPLFPPGGYDFFRSAAVPYIRSRAHLHHAAGIIAAAEPCAGAWANCCIRCGAMVTAVLHALVEISYNKY